MEMLKENKTFCFLASQSREDWLTNKQIIPLKLCWVKCLGAVSAQARVRCLRRRFNTRRQETSGYFKWRRAVFVGTEPGSFPDPNTGRFFCLNWTGASLSQHKIKLSVVCWNVHWQLLFCRFGLQLNSCLHPERRQLQTQKVTLVIFILVSLSKGVCQLLTKVFHTELKFCSWIAQTVLT